jgi:hypothetical protein
MVTICEIKIQLKQKGIKGVTGLNKAQLQNLLDGKTPEKKTTTNKSFTAKTTGNKPPKRITMKEDTTTIPDNLKGKSYIFLKRKMEKIQNIAINPSSTPSEQIQATKKLTAYRTAMNLAKTNQYGKKKK